MSKVVKLKKSDLTNIVVNVLKERQYESTDLDVTDAEPATKPSPSTNPSPTVDPNRPKPQKPKRENPFEPGRQPKPKAEMPQDDVTGNVGQKFSDDLSGDITMGVDADNKNYVLVRDAYTDHPEIIAIIPKD